MTGFINRNKDIPTFDEYCKKQRTLYHWMNFGLIYFGVFILVAIILNILNVFQFDYALLIYVAGCLALFIALLPLAFIRKIKLDNLRWKILEKQFGKVDYVKIPKFLQRAIKRGKCQKTSINDQMNLEFDLKKGGKP